MKWQVCACVWRCGGATSLLSAKVYPAYHCQDWLHHNRHMKDERWPCTEQVDRKITTAVFKWCSKSRSSLNTHTCILCFTVPVRVIQFLPGPFEAIIQSQCWEKLLQDIISCLPLTLYVLQRYNLKVWSSNRSQRWSHRHLSAALYFPVCCLLNTKQQWRDKRRVDTAAQCWCVTLGLQLVCYLISAQTRPYAQQDHREGTHWLQHTIVCPLGLKKVVGK